ncbi:ThuA domain-containing protein [Streptomyces sp. NPDC050625]|uniref:ThuA domain-containing protein n=1 Tax=Streptomyces sp. NPDC050625 TaxID=3154629 RepID=UPI003435F8A8
MDRGPRDPLMAATRTALVVRGGWEGHAPRECTDLFLPALAAASFSVTVREDLEVYADPDLMARTDLVVQCWTGGRLTEGQCAGLVTAVEAGTGFAGWHGGVVATFQDSLAYLRMVGGLFLHHPAQHVEYRARIEPEQREHPIVAGLPDVSVFTEQYWMLTDAFSTVLASTTIAPSATGQGERLAVMPVVWTRQ